MIIQKLTKNPFDGKTKPWKPWYGYLFGVVAIVSVGLYVYQRLNGGPAVPTSTVPSVTYNELVKRQTPTPEPDPTPVASPTPTPSELSDVAKAALEVIKTPVTSKNLAVPFTSQAPFAVWDVVHEDTCEEAAIYMAVQYFDGVTGVIDPAVADTTLLAMVDMETKMGLKVSVTVAELGAFTEAFYPDIKATVVDNPTVEQIKAYINAGIPVVVPARGRELGNPFYSGLGPLYHLFTIRGYDGENFITNDPGTRRGENYIYPQSVVMSAMADWNDGDVANGAKRILILEKK